MANMENGRAAIPERLQEIGDPRDRVGIVAPFARRFPFIERTLHIDNNKSGTRSQTGHGRTPDATCTADYWRILRYTETAFFPQFKTRPNKAFENQPCRRRLAHIPNAIITTPASANQVMAYCMWSSRKCTSSGPGFGMPLSGTGVSRSI